MTIIVDGYAVHYEQSGKGPLVLMLHGWGDNLQTFKQLSKELGKEYTVLTLDLLGFGASDAPREPFDLELYARFVASFLEKLNIHGLHSIVGHSNGGAIAIKGLSLAYLKQIVLYCLQVQGCARPTKAEKKRCVLWRKLQKSRLSCCQVKCSNH